MTSEVIGLYRHIWRTLAPKLVFAGILGSAMFMAISMEPPSEPPAMTAQTADALFAVVEIIPVLVVLMMLGTLLQMSKI